jgi:hypothetical protein
VVKKYSSAATFFLGTRMARVQETIPSIEKENESHFQQAGKKILIPFPHIVSVILSHIGG